MKNKWDLLQNIENLIAKYIKSLVENNYHVDTLIWTVILPHWKDFYMAKSATIKIRLKSSESGFFYVTKKNSRTMTDKLKVKKYDPTIRKHVMFKEDKIK